MKKYLLIFIVPFLFSCNTKEVRITMDHDEFLSLIDPIGNNPLIKKIEGKPFTGTGYLLFDSTKNIRWEGEFSNGFLNGPVTIYYDNIENKIDEKLHFLNGRLHGSFEKFNENEQLIEEGEFYFGNISGKWNYYNDMGEFLFSRNYTINENGKENGLYREWYKNGQIKLEGNYKNGKKNGVYREWYDDGQIKLEGNYKNGKENGLYREWYKWNQLSSQSNYKNGKLDGYFQGWDKWGTLRFVGLYKDDKKNGPHKSWFENGKLESEKNYKDGQKDGPYKMYFDNGQLRYEGNYKDGELISEKCWDLDRSGNQIKCK